MAGTATVLIVTAGLFDLALAVFHLFFWRLFAWERELPRLGDANRGIMQVLNLSLTYLLVVAAGLLLLFVDAVANTELGRFFLLAMTGFWLTRAIYQPMFFGLGHPMSATMLVLFIFGVLLHGFAWWSASA